jgi:hypothetical protein
VKKGTHIDPQDKRDQVLALRDEHAYQLLLMHEESLQAWDEFQELQEGGDPEHARKLAAIRTELLRRHKSVGRSQD